MREGMRLRESGAQWLHFVRYEELACENPDPTLSRLLDVCALEDDRIWRTYARRVLRPASQSGPVNLDPVVADVFVETMGAMGYG